MADFEDFDAFYSASSRRVLAHVSAMVGSQADAEDAVAEAYLKAWNRWNQVRQYDSPEAWVRRVAYRNAISTWRRAVNRLRAHHRDIVEQEVEALNPNHVALVTALRRIPADQRRVIVLHHLVGLSVAEIAQETGAAPGTVMSWLSRGRRAMAAQLADEDPHAVGGIRDV
jgi:RNA polymerase sigma-70 factor (sigma-E family)